MQCTRPGLRMRAAGQRAGGRAGQAHAARNYNVPAASTQAIQSPAGGQESLWREEMRGGEGGGTRWEGGEDRCQKGQTHRRVKERKRQQGAKTPGAAHRGWGGGVRTELWEQGGDRPGTREQEEAGRPAHTSCLVSEMHLRLAGAQVLPVCLRWVTLGTSLREAPGPVLAHHYEGLHSPSPCTQGCWPALLCHGGPILGVKGASLPLPAPHLGRYQGFPLPARVLERRCPVRGSRMFSWSL